MLTVIDEGDSERVPTVREATIDAALTSTLGSVLDDAERGGIENLALQSSSDVDSVAGDFPSWRPSPARSDMRYFARWGETLSQISRLKAKAFAAYDGGVGAAAVGVGLVMNLRLASAPGVALAGKPFRGALPGYGCVPAAEVHRSRQRAEDSPARCGPPAEHASRLGCLDVAGGTVEAAADAALEALRPVTPEAACVTRRILDDCYLLENSAATELAEAARYEVRMPNNDD